LPAAAATATICSQQSQWQWPGGGQSHLRGQQTWYTYSYSQYIHTFPRSPNRTFCPYRRSIFSLEVFRTQH